MSIKEPPYSQGKGISYRFDSVSDDLEKNTVFCFKHVDREHDVQKLCSKSNKKFVKGFVKKLQGLSQITMAEVQSSDKYSWGYELLKVKCLYKRLPTSLTEDVEQVHVFRFSDEGRIVGYYSSNIFHVLFIDTDLCLYDHGK